METHIARLKPLELLTLKLYREFHQRPPTIFRLIQLHSFLYLVIGLPFFLYFCLSILAPPTVVPTAAVAGVIVGALVRDIGWFRGIIKSWPIHERITDWKKVEELLADE